MSRSVTRGSSGGGRSSAVIMSIDEDEEDEVVVGKKRGQSSSSASSSSSQGRLKNKKQQELEEGNEDEDEDKRPRLYNVDKADLAKLEMYPVQPSAKNESQWNSLPSDEQCLCVKTIVRLLSMKGARKESVTRNTVIDALGKVNTNYKKHINMVLSLAQDFMGKVMGFSLTVGNEVRGLDEDQEGKPKKDEIFISNFLKSPKLLECLSSICTDDAAFSAFAFVIMQILYTSPGRTDESRNILAKLRRVDPRFPETLLAKAKNYTSKACPVPELKEDFLGLLAKMKRRGYIKEVKDDSNNSGDVGKIAYQLAVRYHIDIGQRSLMRGHFATMDQGMDPALLKEFVEQEEAEEGRRGDTDGEEEDEEEEKKEEKEEKGKKVRGKG